MCITTFPIEPGDANRRYALPSPSKAVERSNLIYNGFTVELKQPEVASEAGPLILSEGEPMLYCPVCSRRLTERKCKLLCEQCGYYMSCADYY